MSKIKDFFCKHDFELIEGNIPVHYPDYEPVKYGQIVKCKKCNKEFKFLDRKKYDYEKEINEKIKQYEKAKALDTNNISDGSHTFAELYDHRAKLFSIICNCYKDIAWKSRLHSDGKYPFDDKNWFIVGIKTKEGQATYHYEMKYWDLFDIKEIDIAPEWDGHTPSEALKRLLTLKIEERN